VNSKYHYSINGLDIMVTLHNVYFGYIKSLCKIFTKYIVPILRLSKTILLYFLQLLQMTFIIIILYIYIITELIIKNIIY